MNILYLTNEAPFFPAGGIATYLSYASQAMADNGHNIFILSWLHDDLLSSIATHPFPASNVKIVRIDDGTLNKLYPGAPRNHAVAAFLSEEISNCVKKWEIDVIEAADYLSPALMFYQSFQNAKGNADTLCVTFNHGFIQDFYDADQIVPSRSAADDLVGERLQCRVSDLLIAPSTVASRRLRHYGIQAPISIVREPYIFESEVTIDKPSNSITYLGRVSISKGIDKIIQVANNIDIVYKLDQVLLIGRLVDTPFRISDVRQYVLGRISPRLRDKVIFTDFLPRNLARSLLKPGAYCPSLGSAETFSYACIESIDSGLIPIVRANTPMAEFFPEHISEYVFDEHLGSHRHIIGKFEKLHNDCRSVVKDIVDHNKSALDPSIYASKISDIYEDGLRSKKGFRVINVRKTLETKDVTILMPVFKPNDDYLEAIDSLVSQTAQGFKIHICDDGTPSDGRASLEYALMRMDHVQIIQQPNNGLLGARTTLIDSLDTDLAIFLDADDILVPNFVEKMLHTYNESILRPNAVLSGRLNFGESDEAVIRNYFEDFVHLVRNDFRMTGLIEARCLRDVGFDPTRRNGEGDDWIFWLNFFARGFNISFLPNLMFRYRVKSGSMSWPWSKGQTAGTLSMIREAAEAICKHRPDRANNLALALQSIMSVD